MSMKKRLVALSMSLLVVGGTMISTMAYSSVIGTAYQTVTLKDIPGGGRSKANLELGSKKATTGSYATFNKIKADALLGNFGELVNLSQSPKSDLVGMPMNTETLSKEKSCSKGSVYFLRVASHTYEPSNTCDVTVLFSADNLK